MINDFKSKLLVLALVLFLLIVLSVLLNPKQDIIKETEKITKKTEKINITESKLSFSIKPKLSLLKRSKDKINVLNVDSDTLETTYLAYADTVITVKDTSGKIRGVFELNTAFISDKEISENAHFDFKYLIKSFNYDTQESQLIKESRTKESENLFDRLGIGLFVGGIYTNEKTLSYGIGVGIIYKLTD